MQAFFDFLAARARKEGYDAYYAGQPCHAPQHFWTYAGHWVEGWESAALEALTAPIPVAA
jgi:hypothetical protein